MTSVVIAAHNEASVLGVTIDHLAAQKDAPDLIVIADDGSSDDTPARLKELYGLAPPALGELSAPSPTLPALRKEFIIDEYEIGKDHWVEGFVTV